MLAGLARRSCSTSASTAPPASSHRAKGELSAIARQPPRRAKKELPILGRTFAVEPQEGDLITARRDRCDLSLPPMHEKLHADTEAFGDAGQIPRDLTGAPRLPLRDGAPRHADRRRQPLLRHAALLTDDPDALADLERAAHVPSRKSF